MKLLEHSVGFAPFWIIQGMFIVCLISFGVYYGKIHQYGPSVAVKGITGNTVMKNHDNDEEYAMAIIRRFNHEFYNWNYIGHINAKKRAAYYCSLETGRICVANARKQQLDYERMLMTSNGKVIQHKIKWHDPNTNEYVIAILVKATVWQAHKKSERYYRGMIELGPVEDEIVRPFTLNIKEYFFEEWVPENKKKGSEDT